jgi:serine/threonine protein kinase
MATTDLGACEWFLWDLRRSNLLDRGQLDQVVGAFLEKNPRAEPPQLAQYLIQQGILTEFQADRLLQGKTQGFVLGPYVLMDSLGTGSLGTVYRAQSKNDGQWYAVKVLPRRSMWNVRVARRKVRVFEEFKHPAVVPFVDVGTSGGMHYLSWPLVEGQTLEKVVAAAGRLRPEQAADLALKAAEGLEIFHNQSHFHGILKPSNLMVGPNQELYILDFGLGALLAESEGESLVDTMSTANSVASGLDCASPESIMDPSNLTPAGDQYSLGCVLYYCLAGRLPFPDGSAAEKMIAQQTKEPPNLADLAPETPPGLVALVQKMMSKAPANRFATTGQLIEALRLFAGANRAASAPAPRHKAIEMPRPQSAPEPQAPAATPMPRPTPIRNPLPTRDSLRSPMQAPRTVPTAPVRPAPASEPVSSARATPPPATRSGFTESDENPDKFGTLGVAVSAVLLSVLAWLVSWKMF